MRRTLGTAVFSGMIGVTLFGIFLTPVFFYVVRGLTRRTTAAARPTRRLPPGLAADERPCPLAGRGGGRLRPTQRGEAGLRGGRH